MANEVQVLFKKGTQSALNALRTGNTTTAVEGAFYLTTDTNRLYIGKNIAASGSPVIQPVPVNEGVTVVTNVSDLPAIGTTSGGEFYYVSSQNILCVSSGDGAGAKAWVQINPDTDTSVSDFEITSAASGGVVTITQAISTQIDEGGSVNSGDSYDDTMQFVGDNGVDVSLGAAQGDHNKVIIEGEKTTLSGTSFVNSGTTGAKINLTSDKHDSVANDRDSSVTLMPGTGMSMSTSNGVITFNCEVPTIDGGTVTFDPGITSGSTVGFTVTVADEDGNTASGTFDPTIQLGTHSDALIHFDNGKATLPVYTKDEVDARVKEFDAMTYKGTLGSTGSVQNISIGGTASSGVITQVDVGDTFKVSGGLTAVSSVLKDANGKLYGAQTSASDTTHNGIELKDGDLLIAQGTEGSDGHITAASLKFDYVPSGNDYDSQYKGTTVDNGINFYEAKTGDLIGGLVIAASSSNDYISVTDNTTANTDRVTNTVTLQHKEIYQAASSWTPPGDTTHGQASNRYYQEPATGTNTLTYLDIVVPQINYDKAGHITGFVDKIYRVCDTFGSGTGVTDLITKSASSSGNTAATTYSSTAVVAVELTLANGDSDEKTMNITSSTLYFAKSNSGDDLIIDLVWGSF